MQQKNNLSALSLCLREPCRQTLQLIKRNRNFLQSLERRRNTRLARWQLRAIQKNIQFPQEQQARQLLLQDQRSRVIAAYHFGDYVYGMNLLASRLAEQGRFLYLSLERGSAAYFANLQAVFSGAAPGADAQYLRNDCSALQISKLLRTRRVNFITFCDIPGEQTQRVEVPFLYRSAWFSSAAVVLALSNRVPVLPVIVITAGKQQVIQIAPQLEPKVLPGESMQAASQRLTSTLVLFLQRFFQSQPWQWRYLSVLPRYFIKHQQTDKQSICQ